MLNTQKSESNSYQIQLLSINVTTTYLKQLKSQIFQGIILSLSKTEHSVFSEWFPNQFNLFTIESRELGFRKALSEARDEFPTLFPFKFINSKLGFKEFRPTYQKLQNLKPEKNSGLPGLLYEKSSRLLSSKELQRVYSVDCPSCSSGNQSTTLL